jgi:hypothetical protein
VAGRLADEHVERDSVIRIATAAIILILSAIYSYAAQPAFEAATVRPSVGPWMSEQIDPGRLVLTGSTLLALIQEAYGVAGFQIAGPSLA